MINSTELLDRLDEASVAATPGPWLHAKHVGGSGYVDLVVAEGYGFPAECADENAEADAALIVAAVNALPQLAAALRAVLDLHESGLSGKYPACQECSDFENSSYVPYPCPTVAAVESALTAEVQP